ncbi:MAG TPA: hypothetical protein VK545_07890, partial [Streptomyces sp.]|nr:hypothetical protein [Streptomyces sp.]
MANPEDMVQSYLQGMRSAGAKERYQRGIESYQGNPMARAAEADAKYLERVQESVSSGRRRNKLLAVPVQRWKDNAKGAGADRLASGAAKAAEKVRAHFTKFG